MSNTWAKWLSMSKKEKADYFRNKDQGPKRTAPGGGGCDKASNMARMFQAAYNCTQGGGSTQVSGGRTPGAPQQTPRPTDPAIQPGSRPAVLLACITQAGSLVRTSSNDPKCAAMRCVQGQTCPCEPAGGPKAQAGDQVAPSQRLGGVIDCMTDDCPGSVKTGTGSPKPPGGGPIGPGGGTPTKPAGK